jgi:hypothetical protein
VTDTLWADISEFQAPVNDDYQGNFICFRSNDGDHLDSHFAANRAWADAAVASGRIFGYLVYYFYRPGVDGAAVLRSMVGTPNRRMAVMVDVEADGGNVSGDQSSAINGQHAALASWLGDARRVVGYGNVNDLNTLWPTKPPGLRIVVADYSGNPDYPGKFAHQYSDSLETVPFGQCDANSADSMAPADLEAVFGFTTPPNPKSELEEGMFVRNPGPGNVVGPGGTGGIGPGGICLCTAAGAVNLGSDWLAVEKAYQDASVSLVLIDSASLLGRFTAVSLH